MSNRYMTQFPLTFEKKVKSVFAKVTFGASGAPTLSAPDSKGIISVTKNSTGDYTFLFGSTAPTQKDSYVKFLSAKVIFNSGASAPAAPSMYIKADNTASNSTATMEVVFNSAGTATNPASGEIAYIEFIFGDSSAP